MTTQLLFSGFGGQGLLFAGKFLAYKGLMEDMEVSWLPSYGPEMRGGTASCSVILSDEPIGSPIVGEPDVLVAMNLPSLDRFEDAVVPGGKIFVDSTLIERKVNRTDVEVHYVPSTQMATDNGLEGLANMILVGRILAVLEDDNETGIAAALDKVISARHADKRVLNEQAIKLGREFQE